MPVADDARELVRAARAVTVLTGAPLVIVNAEPTPYDTQADAVVREPIGTILPVLVDA